jgi:hypothetical protein
LHWAVLWAGVVACAHPVNVPVVELVASPSVQATSEGTLLEECSVVGTGERTTYGQEKPEFDVFASIDGRAAAFVIAAPSRTHVTWSHFPTRINGRHGRARVELGGQEHLRFTGYARLQGRTFSVRARMYAEPGHLWARAGAPVEMLAVDGGVAVARVRTSFVSPKELLIRGACKAVVYEPEEPQHAAIEARKDVENVLNAGVSLDLFASGRDPKPFTTIITEGAQTLSLDVIERHGGFVRVAVDIGDIGFDAWVRSSEVTDDLGATGIGLDGFGMSSHCGGIGTVEQGVIARDTPLFLGTSQSRNGEEPVALASAVVEKNAVVYFWSSDETTVDDKVMVPFTFADAMITSAGEARFWIAKDAIVVK